jgi:prealbumin domain-containing protein
MASIGRSSTRLMFILLATFALVMSLLVSVQSARAGEPGAGTIAIFKTMCASIGQQDTCNGRDTSLAGYHIDYTITDTATQQLVTTITVTLGENAGGGGNTGGGSQGRIESDPLPVAQYKVCEAPDGAPIAYLEGEEDVLLDALPRPESGNGGSTGGPQTQEGDCIVVTITTGTSELKFLDQQLEPEGTGSIEVLKTDDSDPAAALAGAEFTVEGVEGTFTTDAAGTFCVDGLELDSTLTVTETKAPEGFELADPASQEVTVTAEGMCNERESGPDATFVNTPREDTAGGNPTPTATPTVPDTAMNEAIGQVVQMPVAWISLAFIGAVALLFGVRLAHRR